MDSLACGVSVVDDESVAGLRETEAVSDASCSDEDVADRRRIRGGELVDVGDVPPWYDENVRRCDGTDVPERDDMLVFVDDVARDLLLDDVAEKAAHGLPP
jgi:hypothetical protein